MQEANQTWPLDSKCLNEAQIFIRYERKNGENEVKELFYEADRKLNIDELKEAVIDRIGTCVFADDLTVTSNSNFR